MLANVCMFLGIDHGHLNIDYARMTQVLTSELSLLLAAL